MAETDVEGLSARGRPSYGRFGLIGCAVAAAFVLIIFSLVLISFYRSPYYRNLAACRMQIERVGAALQRYATKNDTYPASLKDLVPDYIPAKALHCPADEPPSGAVSYIYTKQKIAAADKSILLTCDRHGLAALKTRATLKYLKNGQVVLVNREAEESNAR